MALFKLQDSEYDVGEYSGARTLYVDILQKGERFFSEDVMVRDKRTRKGLVEIVRLSDTTIKVCFNNQIYNRGSAPHFHNPIDIIIRRMDGRAIASAFNVGTVI